MKGIAKENEDGRSVSAVFDAEYNIKTRSEEASSISRSYAVSIVRNDIALGRGVISWLGNA